ncbi:MAG TPA: dihydrofolate reductase family protein [Methanomicrobiales archaeon]|nr:dihydrofolate reductase family protein [Methanomicrobiales archaeon]
MGKIGSFTHVSLDGFFAGPNGEIDWFKGGDEEDREFSARASGGSGTLIFGRTTYEMMASYWPTPEAMKMDPDVARVMNTTPKMVFSRTMKPVMDGRVWKNVQVINEIRRDEIMKMKREADRDFVILGSGSIVQQFARLGLIDEYQLMVNPVILGAGKYLFRDVDRMNLELLETRPFRNGKVFLRYRPA